MSTEKRVRITSRSFNHSDGNHVTISGLTEEERDMVTAAIEGGLKWIRTTDHGRLACRDGFNKLLPVDDEKMLPFWREFDPKHEGGEVQTVLDLGVDLAPHHPSITIQNLCGHNYTRENYRRQAELLESWGFECLRSRRGNDGKYWEVWFLSSLWCAKDDLKGALSNGHWGKDELSRALEFLRNRGSFGTLDVSVQKLAMVIPD